jgi:hypothetical protein
MSGAASDAHRHMKALRIAIAIWLVAAAAGCSSKSSPQEVTLTEEMLSDAGFNPVVLQSSDEIAIANTLPVHQMHYYNTISGPVFWYYDPDGCGCVYVGGIGDYDRYQIAEKSQNDVDAYLAESQDNQVASLYTLNPWAFPAPFMFTTGVAFNYNGGLYSWWPHPYLPVVNPGPIVGSTGGKGHGLGRASLGHPGWGLGGLGGMGHGGGHGR